MLSRLDLTSLLNIMLEPARGYVAIYEEFKGMLARIAANETTLRNI